MTSLRDRAAGATGATGAAATAAVFLWGIALAVVAPARARAADPAPPPSAPPPAAAPVGDVEKNAALAATREGNRLLDAGKPEEALAKFQEAHRLVGGDKLRYNLGQALRAIPGREVDAYVEFDTFLARVPNPAPEIAKAATAERDLLRGRLGFIAIQSTPADASVSVDGRAAGKTPIADPIVVKPGPHAIRVEKAGHQPLEVMVTVKAGERLPATFTLVPAPPVAATAPAVAPAPPPGSSLPPAAGGTAMTLQQTAPPPGSEPATSGGVTGKWWFWAAVAVGAAAIATGAILLASGDGGVTYVCPAGVSRCERLP
jgi:hypothetical protein